MSAGDTTKRTLKVDDPLEGAEDETAARKSETSAAPTIRPTFDVERYAQDALSAQFRDRASTLSDEVATEQARIDSVLMDSTPPAESCELAELRRRLSPLSRVPILEKRIFELDPSLADPKTVYVLGFVDGVLPLETIIEAVGMPELDLLRMFDRVLAAGVISFRRSG